MTFSKNFFGREDRMGWGYIYDRSYIRKKPSRWKPYLFFLGTMYFVIWSGPLIYRFVYDNPIWETRVRCFLSCDTCLVLPPYIIATIKIAHLFICTDFAQRTNPAAQAEHACTLRGNGRSKENHGLDNSLSYDGTPGTRR